MSIKEDIIESFNALCKEKGKLLSREEYRNSDPKFHSGLVEKVFGSWTAFRHACTGKSSIGRCVSSKEFDKKVNKVVITTVYDGTSINKEFFDTLQTYCHFNKAEFGILWGKKIDKKELFDQETYDLLEPYFATEFTFEKDPYCIVKDYLIPATQKNPLLNIDKISTSYKTIILGCAKQYLKVLPYKQYEPYRVACTTGTLSNIDYKETVPGSVDNLNHTYGAILLEWDDIYSRYVIRHLVYKNGCICDLDLKYFPDDIKSEKIEALVLGDLHLPEEDPEILEQTQLMITDLAPKTVVIHDLASWRSIAHHEYNKYLDKQLNNDPNTQSLEIERKAVINKLMNFIKGYDDTTFLIVKSNHDLFVEKWLNTGDFAKDSKNAKIGAHLFSEYLENKTILTEFLPKNVKELPYNANCKINGFEVGEHGDSGISGSKGSAKQYSKTFINSIIGHTHSPEIWEKTIVVGTSSKLILNYNQKGMTCWAHAHAIIHSNNTAQLIFL